MVVGIHNESQARRRQNSHIVSNFYELLVKQGYICENQNSFSNSCSQNFGNCKTGKDMGKTLNGDTFPRCI